MSDQPALHRDRRPGFLKRYWAAIAETRLAQAPEEVVAAARQAFYVGVTVVLAAQVAAAEDEKLVAFINSLQDESEEFCRELAAERQRPA